MVLTISNRQTKNALLLTSHVLTGHKQLNTYISYELSSWKFKLQKVLKIQKLNFSLKGLKMSRKFSFTASPSYELFFLWLKYILRQKLRTFWDVKVPTLKQHRHRNYWSKGYAGTLKNLIPKDDCTRCIFLITKNFWRQAKAIVTSQHIFAYNKITSMSSNSNLF